MFHDIDPDIKPQMAEATDGVLRVTWPDGHRSSYDVDWLLDHVFPGSPKRRTDEFLWDSDSIRNENVQMADYESYLKDDEEVKVLLRSLVRYGFGIVKNAPPTLDATRDVAERISYVQVDMEV